MAESRELRCLHGAGEESSPMARLAGKLPKTNPALLLSFKLWISFWYLFLNRADDALFESRNGKRIDLFF